MENVIVFLKNGTIKLAVTIAMLSNIENFAEEKNKQLTQETLSELLPIVHCNLAQSKYERILMTELRDSRSSTEAFRNTTKKIAGLLVNKVVEHLPTYSQEIETPVSPYKGEILKGPFELVSVMRSGDALLETFSNHFNDVKISKILVQRDEESATPIFKYMKLSPTLSSGKPVIITEPMIATGGTLVMVINLLKERGVEEKNILIASIIAAPEGLFHLNAKFPMIKVVVSAIDEKLNEKKYIVPGLGDFGDRFYGTVEN